MHFSSNETVGSLLFFLGAVYFLNSLPSRITCIRLLYDWRGIKVNALDLSHVIATNLLRFKNNFVLATLISSVCFKQLLLYLIVAHSIKFLSSLASLIPSLLGYNFKSMNYKSSSTSAKVFLGLNAVRVKKI